MDTPYFYYAPHGSIAIVQEKQPHGIYFYGVFSERKSAALRLVWSPTAVGLENACSHQRLNKTRRTFSVLPAEPFSSDAVFDVVVADEKHPLSSS